MSTSDLTVEILKDIREEIRGMRGDHQEFRARFDRMDARFEVIETTLRDLAEQLVILGRGVKLACLGELEHRTSS